MKLLVKKIKTSGFHLLLGLLITWGITQCSQPDTDAIPFSYDTHYFPLDSGSWRIYQVTQITIDTPVNLFDTLNYELKEVNSGYFTDAANDSMMKIERFIRLSTDESWSPVSVWSAGVIDHKAIQVEDNEKYVKINFPAELDKTWDGDAYNRLDTLKMYSYTITSLNEPDVINLSAFDSVLVVNQKDDLTLINKLFYQEKYAYGVGMVERTRVDIYSEFPDSRPIERRVTKGTMYYQKISSYGKNN